MVAEAADEDDEQHGADDEDTSQHPDDDDDGDDDTWKLAVGITLAALFVLIVIVSAILLCHRNCSGRLYV